MRPQPEERRVRAGPWRAAVAGLLLCVAFGACHEGPVGPSVDDFEDEPASEPRPDVVAFVDVHVLPMDAERVLRSQTVIIQGERIAATGPFSAVAIPPGAFRIEGRGRYLVPGLVDMHVHLTSQTFAHLRYTLTRMLQAERARLLVRAYGRRAPLAAG